MLILINQVVHFFLKRVDDEIEFVTLIDQLTNGSQTIPELKFFTVEL